LIDCGFDITYKKNSFVYDDSEEVAFYQDMMVENKYYNGEIQFETIRDNYFDILKYFLKVTKEKYDNSDNEEYKYDQIRKIKSIFEYCKDVLSEDPSYQMDLNILKKDIN
jgi:hypothetical protein